MTSASDLRLLRLHPADNVLTVIATLEAGDHLRVDGTEIEVPARLPLGHKVAARAIAAGEKIFKYGAPIGSATRPIAAGEHVHTHNLKSDYLATVLREDQARFFAEGAAGAEHPTSPSSAVAGSGRNIQHPTSNGPPGGREIRGRGDVAAGGGDEGKENR